jgi:hypothetical protein
VRCTRRRSARDLVGARRPDEETTLMGPITPPSRGCAACAGLEPLAALPPRQRAALGLRISGHSHGEIAAERHDRPDRGTPARAGTQRDAARRHLGVALGGTNRRVGRSAPVPAPRTEGSARLRRRRPGRPVHPASACPVGGLLELRGRVSAGVRSPAATAVSFRLRAVDRHAVAVGNGVTGILVEGPARSPVCRSRCPIP